MVLLKISIKSFHQFANQTSKVLIVNGDDDNVKKQSKILKTSKLLHLDLVLITTILRPILKEPNVFEDFTLMKQGTPLTDIRLSVPGNIIL